MELHQKQSGKQTTKSVLLLAGAFVFAFLLAEMVHEFGHYLAHLVYRTPGVSIHLDPFGGTHISGVGSIPGEPLLVTTVAGPLASLVLGISTTLLLWRFRKPVLLPILLWGPLAMVQEGVNLSLGLLSPGSDAVWISALLLTRYLVLLIGLMLLLGGILAFPLLLPLAAIQPDMPGVQQLGILLSGMGTLMLVRFVHSMLAVPASFRENFFPLLFAVLLSAVIVSLHFPIVKKLNQDIIPTPIPVPGSDIVFALMLGGGMFLLQLLALN